MKRIFIIICILLGWISSPQLSSAQDLRVNSHSIEQTEKESIEITVSENRIKVKNAPIGSKLEIYSVVGSKIKEIELKQSSGEYVVNIAKGYYIIRIGETVRKVAIR